ncbi:MAG TPA: helix-turn-helix transcriptional regulator [Chitinolyticbacter sp.]|uniref:helix-turn-helix transcriptional regulator n=1 Tax=Chitinolyticbacter albus TaxID=2961951 RepID=UPI00210DFEBE|nr:AraC family transcriptional regulator [Chitinolyticbacter albus]HSC80485.1 helix-turn-helix transcriptional regulator [Chitinolyticbacter sp.]
MSTIYQEMFDVGEQAWQKSVGSRIFHHPHLRALVDHDLLLVGHSDARGKLQVERIGAPFHVVLVGVEGEGEVIDGDKRLPVSPGQMAVLPALGHRGFRLTGAHWRMAWFLVNDTPRWSMLAGSQASVRPILHGDSLYHAVALLCEEVKIAHGSHAGPALLLVVDLLNRMLASTEAGDAVKARLEALFDQVRRDPAAEWRVETLAAEYGVSPAHLQRLCVRHLGAAPQQLIIARRMARARELLLAGAGNVGEVASSVGYLEIASFSRRFRQHFDINPGQVLQELKRAPREIGEPS